VGAPPPGYSPNLTDNGKRFYGSLGRATLVFGAGVRF
jgi:hypothetical protein